MTNKAMESMEAMAHRNRWFTELKNGGSFHGYVTNNQMVSILTSDFRATLILRMVEIGLSRKGNSKNVGWMF
jgi:hypothetical protein